MTIVEVVTESICLPVTALHLLSFGSQILLFIAQGPILTIRDANTSQSYGTVRIFEIQAIHSIAASVPVQDENGRCSGLVVLTGGSQVAIRAIHIDSEGDRPKLAESPEHDLDAHWSYVDDWILNVYHHPSQVNSGAFVLLTANNQLRYVQPDLQCAVELIQGPETFLYCGVVTSEEPDRLLVVCGSAFGQVLFWSCKRDNYGSWIVSDIRRFEGHQGSIFGVSMSGEFVLDGESRRLVASCSDDRQINVWDVSDSQHQKGLTSITTSQTGFGSKLKQSQDLLASGTGHLSRIWDVQILTPLQNTHHVRVISRGEDATCQIWHFELPEDSSRPVTPAVLVQLGKDHCHLGKSLWSWTHSDLRSSSLMFTGGADSRVTVRDLARVISKLSVSIAMSLVFTNQRLLPSSFKKYSIIQPGRILAVSAHGDILCGILSSDLQWNWNIVRKAACVGGWTLASNNTDSVAVVVSTRSALIWLGGDKEPQEVAIDFEHHGASISIVCVTTQHIVLLAPRTKQAPPTLIYVAKKYHELEAPRLSSVFQLPKAFTMASSAFDVQTDLLILGSRHGALAMYRGWHGSQAFLAEPCIHHAVHGSDAVTTIHILPANSQITKATYILTTGRDGTYAIHRIECQDAPNPLLFSTIHRCSPPFGPSIEGAAICPTGQDIILYGFRSTSFVAYSIMKASIIVSIECGGAHRSWAYQHSFITNVDTFVWTKAGAVNIYSSTEAAHRVVQQGGHGREIKSLATSPKALVSSQALLDNAALIATGAEDTNIRLFVLPSQSPLVASDLSSLQCLATLSEHTTGPQHLSFSPCGTFLFSSGGCEQFHVYRLTFDVPILRLGVVLQDIMPTSKDDEDVRIMSFEVYKATSLVRPADPSEVSWEIVMAYSNGKAKHVLYTPSRQPRKGHFTSLNEVILGNFCLMHTLFLAVRPTTTSSNALQPLLTAGTNGFLNLTPLASPNQPPIPSPTKQIHQSSILSLVTTKITQTTQLVVTGGDDNALGITLLKVPESLDTVRFQTVLVPKAHTAAITALTVVSPVRESDGKANVLIVSCACDQRVKLWEITVRVDSDDGGMPVDVEERDDDEDKRNLGGILLENIQVRKMWEGWTCVADVSEIGVIRSDCDGAGQHQTSKSVEIVTVGVGMEVLRLRLDGEENSTKRNL